MYTIANATWTMKRIVKEVKAGTINFNCAVQRGYVWDIGRQSLLIHTLLKGDIIPPLYIRRLPESEDFKMEARDGQQRCTTVFRFINNMFKLAKIPEYHEGDKFDYRIPRMIDGKEVLQDLNGLCWEDLTEEEQDKIKDATITIYYIDGATDEEADMIFFKLNNGKALTNTELIRAQARSRDIIKSLGSHELFTKMFSEKTMNNATFDIVTKMWCMLNEDEPNLMSSHIKDIIKTVNITQEDSDRIIKICDFALAVYNLISVGKIAKRMIKKTHFLSLVPIFDRAIVDELNPAIFIKFIEEFFDGRSTAEPTINKVYNNIFKEGSASKSRIRVRHNALMNYYEKLFNGEKEDIYSTNLEDFIKDDEEKNNGEKGVNFDEEIDLTTAPDVKSEVKEDNSDIMNLPEDEEEE